MGKNADSLLAYLKSKGVAPDVREMIEEMTFGDLGIVDTASGALDGVDMMISGLRAVTGHIENWEAVTSVGTDEEA